MNPITISKNRYSFLESTLKNALHEGTLDETSYSKIMSQYTPSQSINFVKILIAIGSLLLGFGVLSFIASNWDILTRPVRLFVIISFLLAFNSVGFYIKDKYPKSSAGLFYVATLIYGAGIFLIGQMFHFSSDNNGAFLLWGIGVLPLALLRKDPLMHIFCLVQFTIWMVLPAMTTDTTIFWAPLVIIPFWISEHNRRNELIAFFSAAFIALWLLTLFTTNNIDQLYATLFFFGLSIALVHQKRLAFIIIGNLCLGISGLLLTVPEVWKLISNLVSTSVPAISFAILFGLYLLRRIQKGSVFSIALICALIVRYYTDLTYDFLPKSVFFIIGGIILLSFGYLIEKRRRQGGPLNE